ncbi:hypothetical protein HBZS_115030 [Helicobacter bizzozeronii CCUG 35545]|nr:hypothetical protein HBZS_115030 [Helicobacter bizzozeronii CCUG 35545]
MEYRQKSLTDKIETLRILIERTTDGATKRILKAEKADYLRELMELISADQTTPPPPTPKPHTNNTHPTTTHHPNPHTRPTHSPTIPNHRDHHTEQPHHPQYHL